MKVHVRWMNLMKNQIKQKFQSFENLKGRAVRQRTQFLNHLIKKICSMGSKNLALDVGHMCNLAKKHVWLSIENHFGIFGGFSSFVALNQNIHTQLRMNVKNHH
jgi:hypothetical protein